MSIPLEIERKYLVDPELTPEQLKDKITNVIHIAQGYTRDNIRVAEYYRRAQDELTYRINVKNGEGLIRTEAQSIISKELFDAIWPKTKGKRIFKTRYVMPLGEYDLEIDFYLHSSIYPLTTVEIEFPSEEAANQVKKAFLPSWIREEITGSSLYLNVNLAY